MKVLKDKILCNDTIKIFCCKLFVQKRLVGKIMIMADSRVSRELIACKPLHQFVFEELQTRKFFKSFSITLL